MAPRGAISTREVTQMAKKAVKGSKKSKLEKRAQPPVLNLRPNKIGR
jgi:hypothetical protein